MNGWVVNYTRAFAASVFLFCSLPVYGSVILFDQQTDTIRVSAGTNLSSAITLETKLLFTDVYNAGGFVFDEWTSGVEDKALKVGDGSGNSITGDAYPAVVPFFYTVPAAMSLNVWHDVAYVYDGNMNYLFLDGTLLGTRANTGLIGNGAGDPFLGAIFRDGAIAPGFTGYLSALRLSNTARYAANYIVSSYTNDGATVLLFDFNWPAGTTTISDVTGNFTGALGSGFVGATSPQFVENPAAVPEPAPLLLFVGGFLGLTIIRRRIK